MLTLKIGDVRESGTVICSLFLGPDEDAPEIDSWFVVPAEIPLSLIGRKITVEGYLGNGAYRVTLED